MTRGSSPLSLFWHKGFPLAAASHQKKLVPHWEHILLRINPFSASGCGGPPAPVLPSVPADICAGKRGSASSEQLTGCQVGESVAVAVAFTEGYEGEERGFPLML